MDYMYTRITSHVTVTVIIIIIGTIESQQCQIPLSSNSSDGYIIPYNINATNDRIKITFACQSNCEIELKSALELQTAICASSGDLETNALNFCTGNM